jgi:hypothetical protein
MKCNTCHKRYWGECSTCPDSPRVICQDGPILAESVFDFPDNPKIGDTFKVIYGKTCVMAEVTGLLEGDRVLVYRHPPNISMEDLGHRYHGTTVPQDKDDVHDTNMLY